MILKSVYGNQKEIMAAISDLYIGGGFHLDPTYCRGLIHRGLKDPELKSDIEPIGDYSKHDCRKLPYGSGDIKSIMFDPPFLAGGGKSGLMNKRFSSYETVESLFDFYSDSLVEFYRILKKGGFLVFKCQDLLNGRVQSFSHCEVYQRAIELGFYARDLFVLVTKTRPTPHNLKKQIHARKFHSYFWVFQKCRKQNKLIIRGKQ